MTEQGTFVDDLLVHKVSDTHYFLCVNAGNQDQRFRAHPRAQWHRTPQIENAGRRYSQLAIQGPKALGILQRFTAVPLQFDPLLSFYIWRSGRRGLPDRAHRIHGRRRLRNLFRAGAFRKTVERSAGRRRQSKDFCPAAWARETRCAWKPPCASMAMKLTIRRRHGKRAWAGFASWPRANSWAAKAGPAKTTGIERACSWDSRCWIGSSRATAALFRSAARRPAASPADRPRHF